MSPGAEVVGKLEREATAGQLSGGEALTQRLIELLADIARTGEDRISLVAEPTVILVAGVNGTGKTTSAGKIAWHISKQAGRSVVLAAADTFRAAGVEQLEQWAQRAGAGFVRGPEGGDPGSVAYEAIARLPARRPTLLLDASSGHACAAVAPRIKAAAVAASPALPRGEVT